jgi:hypothetical protein
MTTPEIGAVCFGFVVGWITYRTLWRKETAAALSNIATVIGAIGGAAVTGLFKNETLFGFYSIGLAVGLVLYLLASLLISGRQVVSRLMGD